jgi:hypothetical protein
VQLAIYKCGKRAGTANAYMTATGQLLHGKGIRNIDNLNNSRVDIETTGTLIQSRPIADTNPALRVNQANAGSTGDLLQLEKEGVDVYAFTHDGTLKAPATFTIDPSAHGNATGKVIILGDLQVDGTTTTINSTTLEVDDKNIELSKGAANKAASDGAGISIDLGTDGAANLTYGATDDRFIIDKGLEIGANTIVGNTTNASLRLNTSVGSMLTYNTNSVQVLNSEIRVNTSNIERMSITSTGNVGIGTASPAEPLTVRGNVRSQSTAESSTNIITRAFSDGASTRMLSLKHLVDRRWKFRFIIKPQVVVMWGLVKQT